MGIGAASDTFELKGLSATEAFDRSTAAMAKIGKVKEVDASEFFIRGTTRYGLQKIRLKIRIVQDVEGPRFEVEAFADDVWSKGARKGIKRFRAALEG
jgi:hypothetical protein